MGGKVGKFVINSSKHNCTYTASIRDKLLVSHRNIQGEDPNQLPYQFTLISIKANNTSHLWLFKILIFTLG